MLFPPPTALTTLRLLGHALPLLEVLPCVGRTSHPFFFSMPRLPGRARPLSRLKHHLYAHDS